MEGRLSYLPLRLREKLMDFQKEGVVFALKNAGRCLFADEMGLGKTLQALAAAYHFRKEWPMLIVVPASLRYTWIEEIEKWFPNINARDINLVMSGSDVGNISNAQITIVTYGLIRNAHCKLVREALNRQQFQVLIVDESHNIKNRKAAGTKFLVPLLSNAKRKFLLTGTPALSRPEELFPQLQAIDPRQFNNWSKFAQRYCDGHVERFGRNTRYVSSGTSNPEELHSLLTSTLMIRRLKSAVLTQLPPKQRQKIPFDLKDSDLKKTLDITWEQVQNTLNNRKSSVNEVLQETAQIPDEMLNDDSVTGEKFQLFKLMSQLHMDTCRAKLGPVKDYIKMICESFTEKMIVFAHHIIMLDSVCQTLIESKIKFMRIDGSTPQQDRPHLVNQFQTDPETRLAVLSMKAAGVGLTLTAANVVVFAELDWTPGTMEQCEDRAHRIGQKSNVHVHYLVANETVDQLMWLALRRKTEIVTTTLNGFTKTLNTENGDESAVQCLSSANAYNPLKVKTNTMQFFEEQNQTPRGQKSVLDFFSPSQAPSTSIASSSQDSEPIIFLLDSDSDEDSDFNASKPSLVKFTDQSFNSTLHEDKIHDLSNENQSSQEHIQSEDDVELPRFKRRRKLEILCEDSAPSPVRPVAASEKWSCGACTFLNHDELPFCEICTTPKSKHRKREATNETSQLPPSQDDDAMSHTSEDLFGSECDLVPESPTGKVDAEEELRIAAELLSQEECDDVCEWWCKDCETANRSLQCEGCLATKPEEAEHEVCLHERHVDLDAVQVFKNGFQFCRSRYTSRVHLYDMNDRCLEMNFVPMDITMNSLSDFPDALLHPTNMRHLTVFVKQWNSLSLAKQRLIIRHGQLFVNPVLLYEELKKGRKATTQRYISKATVASAASDQAKAVNGSLRIISRPSTKRRNPAKSNLGEENEISQQMSKEEFMNGIEEADDTLLNNMKGIVQAVNAEGVPLCINCQKEFPSELVSSSVMKANSWQTRLCSVVCAEQYWTKSSRTYARKAVYDAEHGKCQRCGIEAHQFFSNLTMIPDHRQRAEMIQESKFNQLNKTLKQKMVSEPHAGHFWHVDHINPVSEGGGQCDLDNLRTLCSVCHTEVTSEWRKEKTREKRRLEAGDITAFFKRV